MSTLSCEHCCHIHSYPTCGTRQLRILRLRRSGWLERARGPWRRGWLHSKSQPATTRSQHAGGKASAPKSPRRSAEGEQIILLALCLKLNRGLERRDSLRCFEKPGKVINGSQDLSEDVVRPLLAERSPFSSLNAPSNSTTKKINNQKSSRNLRLRSPQDSRCWRCGKLFENIHPSHPTPQTPFSKRHTCLFYVENGGDEGVGHLGWETLTQLLPDLTTGDWRVLNFAPAPRQKIYFCPAADGEADSQGTGSSVGFFFQCLLAHDSQLPEGIFCQQHCLRDHELPQEQLKHHGDRVQKDNSC